MGLMIELQIQNKLVVILGAGTVGLRKLKPLKNAKCRIRIIDKKVSQTLSDLALKNQQIEIIESSYTPEHLKDAFLLYTCTNDSRVNELAAKQARSIGALVNRCDKKEDSDFYSVSGFKHQDFYLGISSSGKNISGVVAFRNRLQGGLLNG